MSSSSSQDVEALLRWYPRIFFACHRRHVRDPATRRVLSAHQASILDHLDEVDPVSLADLAGHMGVTPGTMSVAVDRLARKGYVRRKRSREDQRRMELTLSEAGVRIRNQQSVLEPELVSELVGQLDPAQRSAALEGLRLLAEAADRVSPRKAGQGGWKPGRRGERATVTTSKRRPE